MGEVHVVECFSTNEYPSKFDFEFCDEARNLSPAYWDGLLLSNHAMVPTNYVCNGSENAVLSRWFTIKGPKLPTGSMAVSMAISMAIPVAIPGAILLEYPRARGHQVVIIWLQLSLPLELILAI